MMRDFVGNMFVVKLFLDALSYLTSSLSINNEWSIRRNIKICLLNCIVIILHCRYYNMTRYYISYLTSSSKIICTYCITANAFSILTISVLLYRTRTKSIAKSEEREWREISSVLSDKLCVIIGCNTKISRKNISIWRFRPTGSICYGMFFLFSTVLLTRLISFHI